MKSLLVLFASVLVSFSAFADKNNNENKVKEAEAVTAAGNVNSMQIHGSVIDKNNSETLAGATVFINGKKYYSDLDGNFTLTDIQPGKHTIRVELISYEPSQMEIDLANNRKLNIVLSQK